MRALFGGVRDAGGQGTQVEAASPALKAAAVPEAAVRVWPDMQGVAEQLALNARKDSPALGLEGDKRVEQEGEEGREPEKPADRDEKDKGGSGGMKKEGGDEEGRDEKGKDAAVEDEEDNEEEETDWRPAVDECLKACDAASATPAPVAAWQHALRAVHIIRERMPLDLWAPPKKLQAAYEQAASNQKDFERVVRTVLRAAYTAQEAWRFVKSEDTKQAGRANRHAKWFRRLAFTCLPLHKDKRSMDMRDKKLLLSIAQLYNRASDANRHPKRTMAERVLQWIPGDMGSHGQLMPLQDKRDQEVDALLLKKHHSLYNVNDEGLVPHTWREIRKQPASILKLQGGPKLTEEDEDLQTWKLDKLLSTTKDSVKQSRVYQKALMLQDALQSCPSSPELSESEQHADVAAAGPILVVGSWNMRAAYPYHKVTDEDLRQKLANLAHIAEQRRMLLVVLQECPKDRIGGMLTQLSDDTSFYFRNWEWQERRVADQEAAGFLFHPSIKLAVGPVPFPDDQVAYGDKGKTTNKRFQNLPVVAVFDVRGEEEAKGAADGGRTKLCLLAVANVHMKAVKGQIEQTREEVREEVRTLGAAKFQNWFKKQLAEAAQQLQPAAHPNSCHCKMIVGDFNLGALRTGKDAPYARPAGLHVTKVDPGDAWKKLESKSFALLLPSTETTNFGPPVSNNDFPYDNALVRFEHPSQCLRKTGPKPKGAVAVRVGGGILSKAEAKALAAASSAEVCEEAAKVDVAPFQKLLEFVDGMGHNSKLLAGLVTKMKDSFQDAVVRSWSDHRPLCVKLPL